MFFFKQKTAYEMRISDWSSDVCSSDLLPLASREVSPHQQASTLFSVGEFLDARPIALGFGPGGNGWRHSFCAACFCAKQSDRKSVVSGKRVSVRVVPGGRRILKKKTNKQWQ